MPEQWNDKVRARMRPMRVPPLQLFEDLQTVFLSVGPALQNENGTSPLDWPAIAAFNAVGGELNLWDGHTLIAMSQGYLAEQQAGENPLRIAPMDRIEAT